MAWAKPTLAEQLPPATAGDDRRRPHQRLGGLLLPESFVDISLTVNSAHPDLQGIAARRSCGTSRCSPPANNASRARSGWSPSSAASRCAVTPEDANKLILAQRHGTLSVTLRGEHDADVAENNGDLANVYSLLGIDPIRRPQHKAEVWRGNSMQEVNFGARSHPRG